jgi:TonB family protein
MKAQGLIIILLFVGVPMFAQRSVTGKVVEAWKKTPVNNAQVSKKGTNTSVQTNFKGFFQINAETKDVLIVTAEGYKVEEVRVPDNGVLQIQLMKESPGFYEPSVDAFYRFLSERIKYPPQAKKKRIQGFAYATFGVDAEGRYSDLTVSSKLPGANEEITKLFASLTGKFIPNPGGKQYVLPIEFRIADEKGETTDPGTPDGVVLTELVVTIHL